MPLKRFLFKEPQTHCKLVSYGNGVLQKKVLQWIKTKHSRYLISIKLSLKWKVLKPFDNFLKQFDTSSLSLAWLVVAHVFIQKHCPLSPLPWKTNTPWYCIGKGRLHEKKNACYYVFHMNRHNTFVFCKKVFLLIEVKALETPSTKTVSISSWLKKLKHEWLLAISAFFQCKAVCIVFKAFILVLLMKCDDSSLG